MDFIFLFSCAISFKIGGSLGDRYHLKYYLGLGMVPASLFFSSIAVVGLTEFHNKVLFGFFMCLNGIFSSTAWPGLLATMGNWFGKGNRGLLMGFWSGNSNVTHIIL